MRSMVFSRNILRPRFFATRVAEPEFTLFPRETEGNVYAVNWSLTEDGVVPVGNAFRNARIPILTNRLGVKVDGGKAVLSEPKYVGKFSLLESGDNISHENFSDLLTTQQSSFSSGSDLFVEDAGLGALSAVRVGVRVVSDNPAVALIARSLLIPVPPRPVDHRARFDGWNFDERFLDTDFNWNGKSYDLVPTSTAKGERPIVALVGGPGETVAVQFVETNKKIVGANIVAGEATPVRGVIAALGHAASVLINEQQSEGIALASLSVVKGSNTVLVIGGDDSLISSAVEKNVLYGAYHNYASPKGVTALWNGVIGQLKTPSGALPSVVVDGVTAIPASPNNLAHPASEIVFVDASIKKGELSEEEAVKRLVELTDESKAGAAAALVKGVKLSVVGSSADAINKL